MTAYVDSLSVEGIMGISKRIDLDLSAALTLVYAPNGTGKTSIWRAAEALFSNKLSPEIACRAVGAPSPKISALLSIEGSNYSASAELGTPTRVSGPDGQILIGRQALEIWARECELDGLQLKGGAALKRIEQHVRAVRFLPAESLLYLIDDDSESTQLRRQLFADLTGTSSLQTERREVESYLQKLQAQESEDAALLRRRLGDLDRITVDSTRNTIAAGPLLIAAFDRISIPADPSKSLQDLLAIFRGEYAGRSAEIDKRAESISSLRDLLAAHPNLSGEVTRLTAELADAESAHQKMQELAARRGQLAKEVNQSIGDAQHRLGKLNDVISRIVELTEHDPAFLKWTTADVERVANQMTASDTKLQLESADLLIANAGVWADGLRSLKEAESVREEILSRLSAEGEVDHSALLTRLESELAEATRKITGQRSLRSTIVSAAQQYLDFSDSAECPCCSHVWQSRDALARAVAEAAASESHLERQEGERVSELKLKLAQAKVEQDRIQLLRQRISLQDSMTSHLRQVVEPFITAAKRLGIVLASEAFVEIEDARRNILRVRFARDLDISLHSIRPFEDGPLSDHLFDFKAQISAIADSLRKDKNRAEELRREIDGQMGALALAQREIEKCKKALEASQTLAAREAALVASLGATPDMKLDLTKIAHELANEQLALQTAYGLAKAAEDAVRANNLNASADRLEAETANMHHRIAGIQAEAKKAHELIELLALAEQDSGKRFFDALGPAVGTLFHHMQVNRVFQQIDLEAAQQSFSIYGRLFDNVSLSPRDNFSQGQKQDLALAMFLVRACSLGGTYFLDEPLVHLDDLNRTALLDSLRACVLGTSASASPVRLLVTTASWSVARHFIQKFSRLELGQTKPIRVYQLSGNVGSFVESSEVWPQQATAQIEAIH